MYFQVSFSVHPLVFFLVPAGGFNHCAALYKINDKRVIFKRLKIYFKMAQLVKKRNNTYSDIKQTCISHINKIDSSVLVIFFILMILNKQNITIF